MTTPWASPFLGKQNMEKINSQKVGFFRFKKLKNRYLLTNDIGRFIFLTEKEFRNFLAGNLTKKTVPLVELVEKGFVRDCLSFNDLIKKYAKRNVGLRFGPTLHIIILTLRCNHKCVYCHASVVDENVEGWDMNLKTAKKTVDTIMAAPTPALTIEFQGGEPLLNWPVLKYIIEYGQEKAEKNKKRARFGLVSNLSLMTEDKFSYLLSKQMVSLCASLDGPEELHNKNRIYLGGNSYQNTIKWLKAWKQAVEQRRSRGYKPNALITITRFSLPYWKEIVDEYIKLGLGANIYPRMLNPFGFTVNTWEEIGYSAEEFIKFYKKILDYILELNRKGIYCRERLATILLTKILTDADPGHLDYRSPCGAGIGQIAYNYNGDVYTCDEGRMMARMGYNEFRIGNIFKTDFRGLMASETVKTMAIASCLEGLTGCADCVYVPYCGVCPVFNYAKYGNIFSQAPNNERCQIMTAIFDYLFLKLRESKTRKIFEYWVEKGAGHGEPA